MTMMMRMEIAMMIHVVLTMMLIMMMLMDVCANSNCILHALSSGEL